ncbi:hypothetical protein [Actinospongicola halichondriae]|uniref:hypothetical protein n=1 Tax=Actinospongicola halichondriae TaxID=3236844 RepID=UPI003D3CECD4
MRTRFAAGLAIALALTACGGADSGDGVDTSSAGPVVTGTGDVTPTPPSTLGGVPDIGAAEGAALVFLPDASGGVDQIGLDVVSCANTPDADADGEVPAELLGVTATGIDADGTEVGLDVRRFRSQGASPTITDTITIVFGDPEAPDRVLVAQRFEVDGLVSDLRDPTADDPLLVVGPGGFEGRGLFGPPGGGVDAPELVEGVARATCP